MISYCPNSLGNRLCLPQKKRGVYGEGVSSDQKSQDQSKGSSNIYDNSIESSSSEINRDEDLSRSCELTRSHSHGNQFLETSGTFAHSVIVLPTTSGGKYSVYPGISRQVKNAISEQAHESFLESLKFRHNISNPELLRQRYDVGASLNNMPNLESKSNASSVDDMDKRSKSDFIHADDCQCGKYHCHKFKMESSSSSASTRNSITRVPSVRKIQDVVLSNEHHMIICNIFWNAKINFCEYKHGDKTVEFQSLWPQEGTVKSLLHDGIEELGLRGALWELCQLIIVNGPTFVLKALLDQNIIRKLIFHVYYCLFHCIN